MNRCDAVRAIINTWELEGSVSGEDYAAVTRHLKSCSACSERYRALIPLLRRDAPAGATTPAGTAETADAAVPAGDARAGGGVFTDQVMEKIASRGFARGDGVHGGGKGRIFRDTAAAAALLVIGGLVLRFAVLPVARQGAERTGPGSAVAAGGEEAPAASPEQGEPGEYVEVHFTLTAPEAEQVALVGDFTGWETSKLVLEDSDGDGVWEARIKLEKGKVYEYNFIIDGEEWIPDPNALMQVDDGFGGESSLLTL